MKLYWAFGLAWALLIGLGFFWLTILGVTIWWWLPFIAGHYMGALGRVVWDRLR